MATHVAEEVVQALSPFFSRYRHRFDDIISGAVDPRDDDRRPHIRFDGRSLLEISNERWAHSQNDALGYFLWLSSTLAANGTLEPDADTISILALLLRYFEAFLVLMRADRGQPDASMNSGSRDGAARQGKTHGHCLG